MEDSSNGLTGDRQAQSPFKRFLLRAGITAFVLGGFISGAFTLSYLVGWPNFGSQSGRDLLPLPLLPQDSISAPDWGNQERVNILVLGVDRRPTEADHEPTRTDALMLLTMDPYSKTASMLSIPRDLWVPIPYATDRVIHDRINTANFYGQIYSYPGGGAALVKDTVQYNLGVRIHYYVLVGFEGFVQLVETLDGIIVDVPTPLLDNQYPTDDGEVMTIFIPDGVQELDGEIALQYVRSRHSDSDFGRMRRQQQVLLAIRDKLLNLNMVPNIPTLWTEFSNTIETDISLTELINLANIGRDVKREDISSYTLELDYITPAFTSDGADVLLPNRSQIELLIADVFFDPRKEQEAAYIEILNGTETSDLASKTAQQLQQSGFLNVSIGDASGGPFTRTEIQTLSGKNYTANLLASFLRLPRDRIRTMDNFNGDSVDIRIILGQDATQLLPLQ